jgi:hypothetical protein
MCLSAKWGDRLLAASLWDVSHNYPRNRRVLCALPSYTRVTKIPLPYGIVAASLRHNAVMLCHHQAHVGHCITVYPGLLKMALIRVQAWQR